MPTKKQISEATLRAEQLKERFDLKDTIVELAKQGKASFSCNGLFSSGIYPLEESNGFDELIGAFEKERGAYVYHVIEDNTALGTLITFLYVSKEKFRKDWEIQRLCDNTIMAYIYNLDEEFGEIGSVELGCVNRTLTTIV